MPAGTSSPPDNASVHRVSTADEWLEPATHRHATLAVVWRGGRLVPRWLEVWRRGGDIVVPGAIFPTFRRRFQAGETALGSVYDPRDDPGSAVRDTSWLLLAEGDGLPSPPPSVPPGFEPLRPNETCPSWVHDRYVATGPDGRAYPTWHHKIDPVSWCYYRHEHGSDPGHFGADHPPLFGYAAAADGMEEPHTGFKNYLFDDINYLFDDVGHRWLVAHPFGTGAATRTCARFHAVGIKVRAIAGGGTGGRPAPDGGLRQERGEPDGRAADAARLPQPSAPSPSSTSRGEPIFAATRSGWPGRSRLTHRT